MTDDSFLRTSESEVKVKVMTSPRKSTLDFVRQFARTNVTIKGTSFNQLIIN